MLSKWNTAAEAAAYLAERTGERWSLARLIERGCLPHVWMDPQPTDPPELFAGRIEGFAAPLLFAGDTQRLSFEKDGGRLTMTRNPEDQIVKFSPGLPFAAADVRFAREEIERLAPDGPPREEPPEHWQDERAHLVKALGLLALLLAERLGGKFKRGDKLNASAVEDAVLQLAAALGVDAEGIKSLRRKIPEAVEAARSHLKK